MLNSEIEIVEKYKYLGMILFYKGNSSSMSILQNLSKYIKQALKKRSSILNNYR